MKTVSYSLALVAGLAGLVAGCGQPVNESGREPNVSPAALEESAADFVARANDEYRKLWKDLSVADWVRSTYITVDTGHLAALANERYLEWHSEMVRQAVRYDGLEMDPATRRALDLLKLGTSMPAPDVPEKRRELAGIASELEAMYGAGAWCPDGSTCYKLRELEALMGESRDFDRLREAWIGWRTIAPPMRDKFARFVTLTNEGAAELGYANLGEMWRSGYDMTPVEFEQVTAGLYEQVRPLYEQLHCHVRHRLSEFYGEDRVSPDGPIPAHVLGNMWSQGWSFIYDILEPYPGVAGLNVDEVLERKNYSPEEMVRSAESFYTSLGMQRLPATFWERSMFRQPADRDVVCHASAWTIDGEDDLRIKMCIQQTYDELRVIYHELGHNYYQWAYKDQPPLFWDGAHSGFHEAIGDTVTLSMTPEYLAGVGLVDSAAQSDEAVINRQMMMALDKIAFLPFGKLIDEWRWKVFSGEITPENYNEAWWDLRTRYQGIVPPTARTEADFDPGAKYHIPANVSYTRYFLAHIMQFQFQKALCDIAGHDGPLHSCSIYGSKAAGEKFWAMLQEGASRPWQETMKTLTGTDTMDAGALIEYFEPLAAYLREQNEGLSCGW